MENNETLHIGIAIVVIMLDDIQHRLPDRPFCDDTTCPCHGDPELTEEFLMAPWRAGLITFAEAEALWFGEPSEAQENYEASCLFQGKAQ